MNVQQMAQQLRHELAAVTWPLGSAEVVFGDRSVFVLAGTLPDEDTLPGDFPFAIVAPAGGAPDESSPDLLLQDFGIASVAEVGGDQFGEAAVVGFNRADYGKSANAGAAELGERARAAVEKLTGADGARIGVASTGFGAAAVLGDMTNVAIDEFTVQAWCTSRLHYAAPQHLQVSGDAWTWQGPHCSSRFDFVRYNLVEKIGILFSDDPSDGTSVYTGTTAATTYTPIAGRTYTIFAEYHPYDTSATPLDASEPVLGSYVSP